MTIGKTLGFWTSGSKPEALLVDAHLQHLAEVQLPDKTRTVGQRKEGAGERSPRNIWCARQDLNLRPAGSKGTSSPYPFQTDPTDPWKIRKFGSGLLGSVGMSWRLFTDKTRTIKPSNLLFG